jgi:hypothetical protein
MSIFFTSFAGVKDFAHVSGYPRTALQIGVFWRILRPLSCEVPQCLQALSNILARWIP